LPSCFTSSSASSPFTAGSDDRLQALRGVGRAEVDACGGTGEDAADLVVGFRGQRALEHRQQGFVRVVAQRDRGRQALAAIGRGQRQRGARIGQRAAHTVVHGDEFDIGGGQRERFAACGIAHRFAVDDDRPVGRHAKVAGFERVKHATGIIATGHAEGLDRVHAALEVAAEALQQRRVERGPHRPRSQGQQQREPEYSFEKLQSEHHCLHPERKTGRPWPAPRCCGRRSFGLRAARRTCQVAPDSAAGPSRPAGPDRQIVESLRYPACSRCPE
jgi:hypothetical protein